MPLLRGVTLMLVVTLLLAALGVAGARGFGSPPAEGYSGGDYGVDRLYEKTGLEEDSPGRSCGELLSMGMTDSGVYWLQPDGYNEPFQVSFLARGRGGSYDAGCVCC